MVNMASETIDKTMLEGMLYGIFPVTTQGNIKAIGLARSPENDTPEAIAVFIEKGEWREYTRKELRQYVVDHHGLVSLISKMSAYIREGK